MFLKRPKPFTNPDLIRNLYASISIRLQKVFQQHGAMTKY